MVMVSEKKAGAGLPVSNHDVAEKTILRVLTCGSVDDGKSTLIGRVLWDTKSLTDDQITALEEESKREGTQGQDMDYALLLDGLEAEREQGITIDVAYRFFATKAHKYIIADTPGHEQYTRNMATGASTAHAAILLVDARKGILAQTCRHARIVSMMGIRHVAVVINKMDLVDYDRARFDETAEAFRNIAGELGFESMQVIPVSALKGQNVAMKGADMPWYDGPVLLDWLDGLEGGLRAGSAAFRFPVQWVNRQSHDFRGFAGTVASGRIAPGDDIVVAGSGRRSKVQRIVSMTGDMDEAVAGEAITLTLEDEIDISRGDMLAEPDHLPPVADQFEAKIIWMDDEAMLPGRPYILKCGSTSVNTQITALKYKLDVETGEHIAAKTLDLNEIAVCNLSLDRAIAFDPYEENRATGSFILIDRFSNATIAAGMIDFPLRRATNIHWHALDVDREAHETIKGHKSCLLWFTGLSGSGKSTVANLVERKLHSMGKHTYLLDGDNVRHGLNRDLGFTDADRVENIRRIAEVGKLFTEAGLITLSAFISPFRSERQMARKLFDDERFLEVFIDTPLEICEQRDPKGLYKKARAGELKNFTGIDSPYEQPENAEIVIDGGKTTPEEAAETIVQALIKKGYLQG